MPYYCPFETGYTVRVLNCSINDRAYKIPNGKYSTGELDRLLADVLNGETPSDTYERKDLTSNNNCSAGLKRLLSKIEKAKNITLAGEEKANFGNEQTTNKLDISGSARVNCDSLTTGDLDIRDKAEIQVSVFHVLGDVNVDTRINVAVFRAQKNGGQMVIGPNGLITSMLGIVSGYKIKLTELTKQAFQGNFEFTDCDFAIALPTENTPTVEVIVPESELIGDNGDNFVS